MKRFAVLVATICLFVVPSTALANSTCQQYSSQSCAASTVGSGPHEPTSAASTQTLPFTGLDVGWLAGGGLTLLGAGLVVRRVSRRLN